MDSPCFARITGLLAGLLFAALAAPAALLAQTAEYSIIDLGASTGTSDGFAINNSGQAVGVQGSYGALWTVNPAGVVSATQTPSFSGTLSTRPSSIDDAGLIVGQAVSSGSLNDATFWRVGAGGTISAPTALPSLGNNGGFAFSSAGNAIVGRSTSSGSPSPARPTLWTVNGAAVVSTTDMGSLGGTFSTVSSLNAAGQAVGASYLNGGTTNRAALWTVSGSGVSSGPVELAGLGGTTSFGYAINDNGLVTGNARATDGSLHATLWQAAGGTAGAATDLGSLGGNNASGAGVNNAGQVVGYSNLASPGTHGFLYTAATGMRDLNNLVGASPLATAITIPTTGSRHINEWGQIIGDGTVGSATHAVLLNPIKPNSQVTGRTQETRLVGGMDYARTPAFVDPLSAGSVATLAGGTAGSAGAGTYGFNRDLTIAFTPATVGQLASSRAEVAGAQGDTFTLQLTYDRAAATALFGGEENLRLVSFDGAKWINAVDANVGGTPFFAGDRAYNPATDFSLGTYGVDTADGYVWAVVDRDGAFGVAAAPEPATWAWVAAGLGLWTTAARRRASGV